MRFGVTVPNLGVLVKLFNGTGDTVLGDEDKDSVCVWFVVCWLKENIFKYFQYLTCYKLLKKKNLNRKYIQNFLGGTESAKQLNINDIFFIQNAAQSI